MKGGVGFQREEAKNKPKRGGLTKGTPPSPLSF